MVLPDPGSDTTLVRSNWSFAGRSDRLAIIAESDHAAWNGVTVSADGRISEVK